MCREKRHGRHGMGLPPLPRFASPRPRGVQGRGFDTVTLALDFFFFLRRFFSIRVRALRTVRRAAEARRARPTKFGRSDSLHMISADVACSKVILCAHLALNNAKSPPSPHHSPRRPRTMEPPGGHFARAPTSPVILRTIKDHFLGRSRINSSNEMGVKWVYKREHTLSRAV